MLIFGVLFALCFIWVVRGQDNIPYTDLKSGISYVGFIDPTGFSFGVALPSEPKSDFIGQLIVPYDGISGWGGVSLNAKMIGRLLVVAWVNGGSILSSLRQATDNASPPVYTGNATIAAIPPGCYVNSTHLSYTFLCRSCYQGDELVFDPKGEDASIGWALSTDNPVQPSNASSEMVFHNKGFGNGAITLAGARSSKYATWAALAGSRNGLGGSGNSSVTSSASRSVSTSMDTSKTTSKSTTSGAGTTSSSTTTNRISPQGTTTVLSSRTSTTVSQVSQATSTHRSSMSRTSRPSRMSPPPRTQTIKIAA